MASRREAAACTDIEVKKEDHGRAAVTKKTRMTRAQLVSPVTHEVASGTMPEKKARATQKCTRHGFEGGEA